MKKQSLRSKIKADPRSWKTGGTRCKICTHRKAADVNRDVREFVRLRERGQGGTWEWFAEVHLKDEYGLQLGRLSVKRHLSNCLGITA